MKINIIQTTTDSEEKARLIAKYLVNKKLSPCVQIIPHVESIYIWKGKEKSVNECSLIIKTTPGNVNKCKKYIVKIHNYIIPEIIITEGEILLDTYRDWFVNSIV